MTELALVPPDDDGFDQDEVRALLLDNDGSVTKAAESIGVDPERLRTYVYAMPALKRAIEEKMAQAVDGAVDVLMAALRDQGSLQNRFYAAKEILRSHAGARRGFGPRQVAALEITKADTRPATVTLKWLEPPKEE